MTLLPVIERELAVRSRRSLTYWGRVVIALIAALISLHVLVGNDPRLNPSDLGRTAFHALIWTAFVLSFEAGLRVADAIWVERREHTLGLLLLTRLSAMDVLMGKVTSCGFGNLANLGACLPLLVLPLLAGGVTAGEVIRQGLAVLTTLLFALAVGALAGVRATPRRGPFQHTLTLSGTFLLLPVILERLLSSTPARGFPLPGLLSPLRLTMSASATEYSRSPAPYWSSLGIILVLAVCLLLLAMVKLRHGIADGAGPTDSTLQVTGTVDAQTRRRWSRSPTANPIGWVVRRQAGIRLVGWVAAVLSAFLQSGIYQLLAFAGLGPGFFRWTTLPGLVVSAASTALVAWGASRYFVEARRKGELEMLATTPLGSRRIVADQWVALRSMLVWPGFLILLPLCISLWWVMSMGRSGFGNSYYVVAVLLGGANTLLRLCATCWVGMWFGYSLTGQARVVLLTTACTSGIPFLLRLPLSGLVGSILPFGLLSWVPSLTTCVFLVAAMNWAKRRLANALPGLASGSDEPFAAGADTARLAASLAQTPR